MQHEVRLTDRKAVQLTELLGLYFRDCVEIDPSTEHPGNLTVRELIEDLAGSTDSQHSSLIEEELDGILDLFATPPTPWTGGWPA